VRANGGPGELRHRDFEGVGLLLDEPVDVIGEARMDATHGLHPSWLQRICNAALAGRPQGLRESRPSDATKGAGSPSNGHVRAARPPRLSAEARTNRSAVMPEIPHPDDSHEAVRLGIATKRYTIARGPKGAGIPRRGCRLPREPYRKFKLKKLVVSTAVALTFLAASEDALAARHEPTLRTPRTELNAALTCPTGLAKTRREPVLLVHGTGGAGQEAWAGAVNLQATLRNAGLASCYVTLPDYALGDLQVSVEYVVAAIRTVYKRTGRRIAIYGLSQGALLPRWALTFWPSLRTKVADAVLVSGTQRGTTWGGSRPSVDALCATGCPLAFIQQTQGSHLLAAINDEPDETPGNLTWTTVRSLTDETVQPQNGPAPTSALDGASNIAIQHVCPGREVRHSATAYDSVAYAALIHAVRSQRSTTPARLPHGVCAHRFAPGLDDATVDLFVAARSTNSIARALAYEPKVTVEPPVRRYALRTR
jgi:triacylglycerol lipase